MAKIHAGREPTYSPAADLELAPSAPGPAPTPPTAPGPDATVEDYRVRTVVELRQLIRERNEDRPEPLPLSGNKPDLIARLQEDDRLRGLVGG